MIVILRLKNFPHKKKDVHEIIDGFINMQMLLCERFCTNVSVISLGNASTVAFCISNGYFTTNENPEKPYVTVFSNEKCLDMIDNGTGAR